MTMIMLQIQLQDRDGQLAKWEGEGDQVPEAAPAELRLDVQQEQAAGGRGGAAQDLPAEGHRPQALQQQPHGRG